MTSEKEFEQFIAREKKAIHRQQPTKQELKELVLETNKHPVLGASDHFPSGMVGVLEWQKRMRSLALEWRDKAVEYLTKSMDALIAIGELHDLRCKCGRTIAWSGLGKPPSYCLLCTREKSKQNTKQWKQKHRKHTAGYMRRFRKRAKKRVPIPDDKNLRQSGVVALFSWFAAFPMVECILVYICKLRV
jgi:hypothetical protein